MTDLEITRLCAEAIGINMSTTFYDPLHDNEQAMELVKRFYVSIRRPQRGDARWFVSCQGLPSQTAETQNSDLNRAICESVAKMQAAKEPK